MGLYVWIGSRLERVFMQNTLDSSERLVLTSFEDVRNAAVEVASCAQRSITIMTPDLEPGIYDSDDFIEAVKRLVLAKRYARIRVLVTEPQRTVRNGNRFVALGRRLNTYVDFRNLREDYRTEVHAAYIIADETAVMYRANGRRYDGIVGKHEPIIARQHLEAFDQPWIDSAFRDDVRMAHI
jgi:hypothetical protein